MPSPQHLSTPNNNQDFVLFDDRQAEQDTAGRSSRRGTAASPQRTLLDNNYGRSYSTQSNTVQLSTPHLANVNNNFSAPNLNHWYQTHQLRRPASNHHTSAPRSFSAYETNNSDFPAGVNMTRDETMNNLGYAESGVFDDDPLHFDSYFNDDAMNEAPVNRFTPINDPNASMSTLPDTVSPADLLYHDFSAPNSNSFTNLTTPSMLDDNSPFLTDSNNVSPAYELGDFNSGSHHDSFAPLFPGNEFDHLGSATAVHKHGHDHEINSSTDSLTRNASAMAMSRSTSARSYNEAPPSSTKAEMIRHRLSINAGISKSSRRATKALGPIDVDEGDERALKRAKNTMAARKSRQKKKDEVEVLESKLIEMVEERDHWKMLAVRYGAPVPEGN